MRDGWKDDGGQPWGAAGSREDQIWGVEGAIVHTTFVDIAAPVDIVQSQDVSPLDETAQ